MKSETQIAKEHLQELKLSEKDIRSVIKCYEHKQSCQRFLEFLNFNILKEESQERQSVFEKIVIDIVKKETTDLKNTIKLYYKERI